MGKYGPPNATSNGFTENLALFSQGKCGIWIDATVAAGTLWNPKTSKVASDVGMVDAPMAVTSKGSHWFWAWALAVPKTTRHQADAKKFLLWATSKAYLGLAGKTFGWVAMPPGTRLSTYDNQNYLKAAPFAKTVKHAILTVNPADATLKRVPYVGVQSVPIPQFQGIGNEVGQQIAAALAGRKTVEAALREAQAATVRTMKDAGYH